MFLTTFVSNQSDRVPRHAGALLLMFLGVFVTAEARTAPIEAVSPLRLRLTKFSGQVREFLVDANTQEIAIGALRDKSAKDNAANRCPGLQMVMRQELEKAGVKVADNAGHQIVGEYSFHVNKQGVEQQFQLDCRIVQVEGNKPLWTQPVRVRSDDPSMQPEAWYDFVNYMTGRQTAFPSVAKPAGEVRKSNVSGPFQMRIFVQDKNGKFVERPCRYERHADTGEDRAFVDLELGETFAIQIDNRTTKEWRWDAAVELTLDGLSYFVFSNEGYKYFIVARGNNGFIKGWHIDNKTCYAFLTTDYGKSAAARFLVSPEDTGLITARIASAWTNPKDEPPSKFKGGVFIGKGERVDTDMPVVKRYIGGRQWTMLHIRYKK